MWTFRLLGPLLLFPCVVMLSAVAQAQQYFANADTHALPWSPGQPQNYEIGDIDGDGDLDLIAGRRLVGDLRLPSDSAMLLWLNEGKGDFRDVSGRLLLGRTDWNARPRPRFVDVDGDKDLDIVLGFAGNIPATTQRQLRVFLNNGKGRFTELANAAPFRIADNLAFEFADMDSDGDPDIIVSSALSLTVLLNNGKGVFTPSKKQLRGHSIRSSQLVLVDVERDGDLDIVLFGVSSPLGLSLLYLNDGKGAFVSAPGTPLPGSLFGLMSARAVDLTGDGIPDIAGFFPTFGSGNLRQYRPVLWRGDGKGRFFDVKLPALAEPERRVSNMEAGDVDGDKDIDILWTNQDPKSVDFGRVRVLENLGGGKFAHSKIGPAGVPARWRSQSVFADFDGDKRLDLLLLDTHSRLLLRDSGNGFVENCGEKLASVDRLGVHHIADVNQDGFPDMLKGAPSLGNAASSGFTGGPVELLLGTPNGRFVRVPPSKMPKISLIPTGFASGDLDGDGDLDVVVTRSRPDPKSKGPSTLLFVNNGKAGFSIAPLRLPDIEAGALGVACFDADGDQDLDLLVFGSVRYQGAGSVAPFRRRLFLNDGKARFKEASSFQFPGITEHTARVATGDLDLDGDIDVIVGNWPYQPALGVKMPGQNLVYLNNGKGFFKVKADGLPIESLVSSSLAIADFNGDRKPDLFVTVYSGVDRLYLGDGKGSFTAAKGVPSISGRSFGAAVGDIDGDGDQDVVVTRTPKSGRDKWGQNYLLLNDGRGRFSWQKYGLPVELRIGFWQVPPTLFDADGDADLDLLLLSQVFENNRRQLSFQTCPRTGYPLEVLIEAAPGRNPVQKLAALFFQVGAAGRPVLIPPFGRFGLDLLRAQFLDVVQIPFHAGRSLFTIPIPNDRRLRGIPLGMQALIAEGARIDTWRFTNMINEGLR